VRERAVRDRGLRRRRLSQRRPRRRRLSQRRPRRRLLTPKKAAMVRKRNLRKAKSQRRKPPMQPRQR